MKTRQSIPGIASFNFFMLVVGQITSVFGTTLLRFALSLYVLDITGRADVYATLFAFSALPVLLVPIAGALADRLNRKTIMVLLDVLNGCVSLMLSILFLYQQASLVLIAIAMVLFGLLGAIDTPVITAIIPSIVPDNQLESANGFLQGVQSISGIIATVLGGLLYTYVGIESMLILTTIIFFLTALLELFIWVPKNSQAYAGNIFSVLGADLKAGFRYTIKTDFIRKTMILSMGLNFVLTPLFIVGIPYIFRMTMKVTTQLYGIGIGSIEFATIGGALLVAVISKKMKISTLYRWFLGIVGLLGIVSFVVSPISLQANHFLAYSLFLLSMILLAGCLSIISIFVISKIQMRTPEQHMGKVMAIIMAASQCIAPLGQILYGIGFEIFQKQVYVPILLSGIASFLLFVISKRMYSNEKDI